MKLARNILFLLVFSIILGTICSLRILAGAENNAAIAAGKGRVEITTRLPRSFNKPGSPIRIDQKNNLFINNEPFFPIGLYSDKGKLMGERELAEIRLGGFNLFIVSNLSLDLARILSKFEKYDLKLIANIPFWDLSTYQEQKIQIMRDPIFKSPAFLSWYSPDESAWNDLNAKFDSLPMLIEFYDTLTVQDPVHPVFMVHAPRQEIYELVSYNTTADVVGVDIYPVPEGGDHGGLSNRNLTVVGDYTERMRQSVEDKKPVWMVLQAFSWEEPPSGGKLTGKPRPTLKELRFMTYEAIVHGAKGVIYYGFDQNAEGIDSPFWQVMKSVTGEIDKLSPVILSVDKNEVASVRPVSWRMKIMQKEHDGNLYLFVVNEENRPATLSLNLKGLPPKNNKLSVLFENRSLNLTDGILTDEIEGYGVHIYTDSEKGLVSSVPANIKKTDKKEPPARVDELSLKAFSDWVYNFKNWQGNWIWLPTDFETPNLTAYMRKVVNLSSAPQEAWCVITADNQYILYVNGRIVGQDWGFGGGWSVVKPYNILPFLKAGDNIISVEAYNYLGPGALFFESKIKGKDYSTQILSDESWLSSKVKKEKWTNLNFNDSKWEKTKIYGKPPGPPWGGDLIIAPLRQEK